MLDQLLTYLLAGGVGALVGVQRELVKIHYKGKRKGSAVFAGIRSYTLIATLGAILVEVGSRYTRPDIFLLFGASIVALFVLVTYIHTVWTSKQFGMTGEFSAVIVFFLGALVMLGHAQLAVVLGILLAIVLTSRDFVQGFLKKTSDDELNTTLKFAVIAFIVLPILPDQSYSISDMLRLNISSGILAMDFFNPYSIWLFVVLMSGISYIGYILSIFIGANRGIGVSGALGGLVSSTAVTSAMAEQSKKHKNIVYPFVFAALIANTIMFVRVLFIVFIFYAELLKTLFIPIGTMLIAAIVLITLAVHRGGKGESEKAKSKAKKADFRSPFQIGPALKFALFIVCVKFLSGWALLNTDAWGPYALYAVSFFSGIADVDAITQDMASRSHDHQIINVVATRAIIIATITNTAVKMGIAWFFGGKFFGRTVALSLFIICLAGLSTLFIF